MHSGKQVNQRRQSEASGKVLGEPGSCCPDEHVWGATDKPVAAGLVVEVGPTLLDWWSCCCAG